MKVTIQIEVEVERESGKFAPMSDIEDALVEHFENSDPDQIPGVGADGDSVYNVVDYTVSVVT